MREIINAIALAMSLAVLGGCAIGQPRGWVEASAWAANYTEDLIYDFSVLTVDGKRTGVTGALVQEFSRGGTTGRECCGLMPGVGQTVKVVWRVGGRREEEALWRTYSRDVVVMGAMPKKKDAYNILLVRFFSEHEVEAELIPDRGEAGGLPSPRVDKLFSGQRVMRKKGE